MGEIKWKKDIWLFIGIVVVDVLGLGMWYEIDVIIVDIYLVFDF